MRFFRLNLDTDVEYEAIRASVDSQIGFSGSLTCISPYATAPQDQKGRVLLSLTDNQPGYDALLASFLALALVKKAKELTQDEYDASFFPAPSVGGGGVSSWNDLSDKPSTFPPSAHTQDASTVTTVGSFDNFGFGSSVEQVVQEVDAALSALFENDTGPAGGDLSGSYPNPTIATGAVTDAKVSSVSAAKLTGTLADARLSDRTNVASTLYLWSSFR